MRFDWSDFLELARELGQPGAMRPREEARLRTAISRAYYAVFCRARNHLLTRYPTVPIPRGPDAQRVVWQRFDGRADTTSRVVATNLERLRDWRNSADYDDTIGALPNNTQ